MARHARDTSAGLSALLTAVVAEFQRASHADIVSLVLFDDAARRYYAPFVIGQPEEGLVASLADQSEQLRRYDEDVAQGKVPEEIHVRQYGSTVWLTATQGTLVAANAAVEIDSTFVRRHHIVSLVGLPLAVHHRVLGLVYLNYCAEGHPEPPDPRLPEGPALAQLERLAAETAHQVAAELASAERAALVAARRLTELLMSQSRDADDVALRRRLSIALSELLMATDHEGAAVYQVTSPHGSLELISANAPIAAPLRISVPEDPGRWEQLMLTAVAAAAAGSGLQPALAKLLGPEADPTGYLVVLGRDPLAIHRSPPAVGILLQAAADLITGALENHRLIGVLEHGNELLDALSRMSTAILQPGCSRRQVLEAVVHRLTEGTVREFDFHFASVFLLGEVPDGGLAVRAAAGVSTVDSIRAAAIERPGHRPARVPVWALDQERPLMPDDVLCIVATRWEPVVVGPAPRDGEEGPPHFVDGYAPGQLRLMAVPVLRQSGEVVQEVPIAVVEDGSRPPLAPDASPPFTLAADIFEANRHGELIRIFVPFGLDRSRRATGVLEVGYVRSSDRHPERTQVEALRAAGSQIAVAVDSARLYEEARRHAEQLEVSSDVSKAIASSIDLDQTLRLVARNLVWLVDASLCQIALYDEDTSGWYGAAASSMEREWARLRGERVERGFLFETLDRGQPLVIEDAKQSDLVPATYADEFHVRSLVVVPLLAGEEPIGAAILAQQDRMRHFTPDEVQLAQSLGHQAAIAIKNARLHALSEEENHIQKDFLLLGFGMWGQKAYQHLLTLKQFFNFRIHVVEREESRPRLQEREQEVLANGDLMYWDREESPASEQLAQALETSCYVITYIATLAATHLPTLARYYGLSDVMMIEKPLGASPEAYRAFLDSVPGGVEIVAADHYYFKLEVRLLHLLLTEERTLREFMASVEEVRIDILESQPLTGAAADIGVVADLIPHALAIVSLLASVDRIQLDPEAPLLVGRHEPFVGERETYARVQGTFQHQGRTVRLIVDVGKGVDDQKCITVSGERRRSGRANFYKFDFARGETIDGTQSNVRAAVRKVREPGVPDNAHLTMLRHVIEKRHPAVGILSIREAIRSNQRIRELEAMALDLLRAGRFSTYRVGQRPPFAEVPIPQMEVESGAEPRHVERERARHG